MLVPASRLQTAPTPSLSVSDQVAPAPSAALGWRALLAAALLALALAGVLYAALAGQRSPLAGAPGLRSHRTSSTRAGLLSLPQAAQGPVSRALGADEHAYALRASNGGFAGSSPTQHFRLRFDRSGVSLSSAKADVGLSLRAVGYGSSLTALPRCCPSREGEPPHLRSPGPQRVVCKRAARTGAGLHDLTATVEVQARSADSVDGALR